MDIVIKCCSDIPHSIPCFALQRYTKVTMYYFKFSGRSFSSDIEWFSCFCYLDAYFTFFLGLVLFNWAQRYTICLFSYFFNLSVYPFLYAIIPILDSFLLIVMFLLLLPLFCKDPCFYGICIFHITSSYFNPQKDYLCPIFRGC